jgi:hypothetical protein
VEQARLLLWWAGMDQEPNYRALSLRLSTAPALSMPLSFREDPFRDRLKNSQRGSRPWLWMAYSAQIGLLGLLLAVFRAAVRGPSRIFRQSLPAIAVYFRHL